MLNWIQTPNSCPIYSIFDAQIGPFGKVVTGYNFSSLLQQLDQATSIPVEGNIYTTSLSILEANPAKQWLMHHIYGGMPIQIGYCNGLNQNYNGFEYHKGSEVIIAMQDIVLALGRAEQIAGNQFDTSWATLFYMPAGSALEIYAHTLHLAPMRLQDSGFKTAIILPQGTNTALQQPISTTETLLLEKNKWVMAHADNHKLIARGAYIGITGNNTGVRY